MSAPDHSTQNGIDLDLDVDHDHDHNHNHDHDHDHDYNHLPQPDYTPGATILNDPYLQAANFSLLYSNPRFDEHDTWEDTWEDTADLHNHYDHHFFNPYPASPPSPPANFLDAILNPAGLDHNRFSPFSYQPDPPVFGQPYAIPDHMPPNTRAHPQGPSRPARLPNGYVDLTATPDTPPHRRKRESPSPGPSAKRLKQGHGSASEPQNSASAIVDGVDLTDKTHPIQDILQKQREDAVKAQTKPEEKATTFNSFNCVICMDTPTDLTATACGHLFCHTCLMEALIAGENRTGPGEQKRSQCPVCRKFISRTKASDIIPLALMKGLATQPRKKVVGPSATAAKV